MEASKDYFLLPDTVKEAFPRHPKIQQGYVAPGREIFDQKEDGSKVNPRNIVLCNRQQPSPLLYSLDIWPARNSKLTQRETNPYITRCASASVLAWSYLA